MLKRIFFIRPLIVSVFLFFFIIDVRATEEEVSQEEKQAFLRENILEKCYDAEKFMEFLQSKKGEQGTDINKWTMEELKKVVNEFQVENKLQANEGMNGNDNPVEVNKNNIPTINNEYNNEIKDGNNDTDNIFTEQNIEEKKLSSGNSSLLKQDKIVQGPNINHGQSSLKSPLYEFSHNKIVSSFFCFYRYRGKFLASLVWSVVNSYCGFEEIVMNDWYCFKYAMCSGYRLQPRFMGSRVWIDMNVNFLEGIAGFLIRFFLFNPSYDMYENIFDLFNICIDIKVYNNLYFAVNIVGIVQGVYCLLIRKAREKLFEKYSAKKKKN